MCASAASRLCLVAVLTLALGACATQRTAPEMSVTAAMTPAETLTPAETRTATADTATGTPTPTASTAGVRATPLPADEPGPAASPTSARAATTKQAAPRKAAEPKRRLPFEAQRAGLAVTKPRGWKIKRRQGALVYEAPMRVPSIVLFEPKGRSLDTVVAGLAQELSAPLGRVRITRAARQTTLAGYSAYVAEGTGTAEGFPMRWRATVVDAEELTVMLALAPSFFWGANERSIRAFERGIRRAPVETAGLATEGNALR